MERGTFIDRLSGGLNALLPKNLFDAFGVEDPQVEIKKLGQITVTNMEPGSRGQGWREQVVMSGSYVPSISELMYATSSGPMYNPLYIPPMPLFPLPNETKLKVTVDGNVVIGGSMVLDQNI